MKVFETYTGSIVTVICQDNNVFMGKVGKVQDWVIRLEKPVRIMPVPTHNGIQIVMNGVNFDPNPSNVDFMDVRVESIIAIYPVKEGSEEYAAYVAATTNIKIANSSSTNAVSNASETDIKKLIVKTKNDA